MPRIGVVSLADIDTKIATHAEDENAHHARYTDTEAGTVAASLVAEHADLPTVHQDAPCLITTHTEDKDAHHSELSSLVFIIDGGGSAIEIGEKGHLQVPFNSTIQEVELLADQDGAIKVDIWKDTYANFPPTDADTICGGNEPEIAASGRKDQGATLTDWTTSLTKGDILAFNVDSCTTITRVTVILKVAKS